ncbi:MAG: twin-arginine translocase TatA/TatE family subunit, partial [Planctomycetaceae bacterium]|nr:twin-arginine translocase TatA/TatE family subunit [Planctomycetaceae bacterium]
MFGLPGGAEMIILLLIILLLFGKRLPTAMFSVGKSITEFKKGMNE